MSTMDIIREGSDVWKKSWLIEIKALLLFAAISTLALIPATLIAYIGYDREIETIMAAGIILTAYIVFLHISFVLGIIYQIDRETETKEITQIIPIIREVAKKIAPLAIVSLFFAIIVLIPLYVIDVFLFDNYMNHILLQIMLIAANYILLIIMGVPWFYSIAFIILEDISGIDAFKKGWLRFNDEISTILPISIIAIFPVLLYSGIVSLIAYFIGKGYDYELPDGIALIGWGISFIIATAIFFIMILPWSLDITFPMYKMKKSETS